MRNIRAETRELMLMLVHAQIEAADRLKIPGKRGESKVNLCIAPLAIAQKEKHGKNSTSSSKTKLQKQKQKKAQFLSSSAVLLLLFNARSTSAAIEQSNQFSLYFPSFSYFFFFFISIFKRSTSHSSKTHHTHICERELKIKSRLCKDHGALEILRLF